MYFASLFSLQLLHGGADMKLCCIPKHAAPATLASSMLWCCKQNPTAKQHQQHAERSLSRSAVPTCCSLLLLLLALVVQLVTSQQHMGQKR